MKMIRTLFFIIWASALIAQPVDTSSLFTLDRYLQWVEKYHPLMKQAALLADQAAAAGLEAKGGFDPKWYGEFENKSFDQKNYFRAGEAGLKVPVWWGADIKMAYSWSSGQFVNPKDQLPENGQAIVGIEVSILQGLFFDERRAQVHLAQLMSQANEATRETMINDFLLEAITTYWQWAFHYKVLEIYQSSLSLATNRFQITKASYLQGDKPAIDTLEAFIQVQNRSIQLIEATVNFQNASLMLSNYLWYENLTPLEVTSSLRPESLTVASAENPYFLASGELTTQLTNHPALKSLAVKQQQLKIKEKWKKEQFKPILNINYNFLSNGFDWTSNTSDASLVNNLITENYKWGVTFNYPLLLRKERGGLELIRLEKSENQLKQKQKQLEIENKISAIYQQLTNVFEQLSLQQKMVYNYQSLLVAENEKFRIGESSIFLLNNREQKLIDEQKKLNKLLTAYHKLKWKLEWAKGALGNGD